MKINEAAAAAEDRDTMRRQPFLWTKAQNDDDDSTRRTVLAWRGMRTHPSHTLATGLLLI